MSLSSFKSVNILCFSFISVIVILQLVEYRRVVVVTRFEALPQSPKVILTWNPFFGDPYYVFGNDKESFRKHGCLWSNCFITDNKLYMPQHRFHAIMFHGFEFYELFYGKPRHRGIEQYYVFFSLESAKRAPIPELLADFYNLTITYRIDSDIPWPYFRVKLSNNGTIIAPKMSTVDWGERYFRKKPSNDLIVKVSKKKRKIAWFVSNCHSENGREKYVKELQKFIEVDIYGDCGNFKCPLDDRDGCLKMLSENYFFYLDFENSHCDDYITEKVVTALQSDTVPIVFSHANLSRFLPPNSYLDANEYFPEKLADKVNSLIASPHVYAEYFWWKGIYTYQRSMPHNMLYDGTHPFCELCRILNEQPNASDRKVRDWWLGSGSHPTCVDSHYE